MRRVRRCGRSSARCSARIAAGAIALASAAPRRRPRSKNLCEWSCSATCRRAVSSEELSRPPECDCTVFQVPVRSRPAAITIKRLMETSQQVPFEGGRPRPQPAILVVHGAPGLCSRSIEPLAIRLCRQTGSTCYVYEQLGNGLPIYDSLHRGIGYLSDIDRFLYEELGELEVHLIGHGLAGIYIMEALMRASPGVPADITFPKLRTLCLIGTPSSTELLLTESRRLFSLARSQVGMARAARHFWSEHYSSGANDW